MNCRRAQSEFSRSLDESAAPSSDADRHFSTCDECGSFRDATVAFEGRYRTRVRSGIDRLRRIEPPSFKPRQSLRSRLLLPLAAAVLVCGWGLTKEKPAPPAPSTAAPIAIVPPSKPRTPRSLLFDGVLETIGPELSFLRVGELLPLRLDQEFHGIGVPDPEIVLPRDLRF